MPAASSWFIISYYLLFFFSVWLAVLFLNLTTFGQLRWTSHLLCVPQGHFLNVLQRGSNMWPPSRVINSWASLSPAATKWWCSWLLPHPQLWEFIKSQAVSVRQIRAFFLLFVCCVCGLVWQHVWKHSYKVCGSGGTLSSLRKWPLMMSSGLFFAWSVKDVGSQQAVWA